MRGKLVGERVEERRGTATGEERKGNEKEEKEVLEEMMQEWVRLWMERSGFELWPGTLCCVLGQDTALSQCLSPSR